ncbi:kinase-like domain-containing protein [Lentinula raphanica]|nr:kinase-like domain-containing protein [Lentinula raphanica]
MAEVSLCDSSSQHASTSQPTVSSPFPTAIPAPTTSQPAVVTTSLAQTTRLADGKKMINQYVMDAKVGSGQHGNVWRCYENKYYISIHPSQDAEERKRIEKQMASKVLAMKIVKRDNPKARRERQYKMLRMRGAAPGAAGSGGGGSSTSGTANGLGTTRPRSTPTVVDGIRTAEQEIRKEIAIMKKCKHPHVVRLYEVIDDRKNEMVFMVMEYLGGGEIQYTNPSSPGTPILTVEQTRRIMRDAILGLEYLHHQGIIHRDIKPANLLWSTDHDRVKIADFGTAHFSYAQRLAAAKASNSPIDDTEEDPLLLNDADLAKRAGSPAFLAPEIVWEFIEWPQAAKFYPSYSPLPPPPTSSSLPNSSSSEAILPLPAPPRPPVTKSIDIWALGVTLYCLLFGKTPFRPPGEAGEHMTEWTGYQWVCNHDWRVEEMMGRDSVLTGGQKAREGRWQDWEWLITNEKDKAAREVSDGEGTNAEVKEGARKESPGGSREGALVMHLLDHFLQKDLERRITLEEVKLNPWFLHDLPNPDYWLRMTSPNDSTTPLGVPGSTSILPDSSSTLSGSSSDTTSLVEFTTSSSTMHADAIIPGLSSYPTPATSSARASLTSGVSGTTASGFITQQPSNTMKYLKSATASDEDDHDAITPLSQIEKIQVTEKERDDAMSAVKFRWRSKGQKEDRGSREGVHRAAGNGKTRKAGKEVVQGETVLQGEIQKGGLSRFSHRITSFLRGAVPSRSRPSHPETDSISRTTRVDRTSSKRSSHSNGRRESKGKDIGDRRPVTSEPNMRLRALKRDDRDARARERERRRMREKEREEAKRSDQPSSADITNLNERELLERVLVGTVPTATSSRLNRKDDKPQTVRPSASAPERRLRERGLEDAERTPRLGTRVLPSSATPVVSSATPSSRDKWKGKAKENQSRRYSFSKVRRSISRSRSPAVHRSRSPTPDAGTGSITPTLTASSNHPPTTSMSPMGKIFSSLSSGWRRSESVVSLGLGLAHGHLTHARSSSSVPSAAAPSSVTSPSSAPSGISVLSAVPPNSSKTTSKSSSNSAAPSSSASPVSPSSPVVSSPTSARPRPNHASTQPQLLGLTRMNPRVRSHSRFFVDSDDDVRSDSDSLDFDDDNLSLFSDEGELLRITNTSPWHPHGGHQHPAELDSLEPDQLSPTSPISFSRSSGYDGSDYEYGYEHRYNSGPPSSSAFPSRRRGWDAVSDGDIVDVMSNLDISDDEEGRPGENVYDK